MKIDGACHCGQVRYRAEIDPLQVELCHCADCQTMSGSAFRIVVPTAESNFELLSGTLRNYTKISESGRQRAQMFCAACGTHIYATSVGDGPKVYGIRVGTIRQRRELRPGAQYWTRSAQDWVMNLDAIEKVATQ